MLPPPARISPEKSTPGPGCCGLQTAVSRVVRLPDNPFRLRPNHRFSALGSPSAGNSAPEWQRHFGPSTLSSEERIAKSKGHQFSAYSSAPLLRTDDLLKSEIAS